MAGCKVPGPLCSTKSEPIDRGTLNRQPSQPPGVVGALQHRFSFHAWELRSKRRLIEFTRDVTGVPGWVEEVVREKYNYFEGYRLPDLSGVLLLPNPGFQVTPWERKFGVTSLYTGFSAGTKAYPVVNSSNEVVGHVGFFNSEEIFLPRMVAGISLGDVVASGIPAFVRKENPNPHSWVDAAAAAPFRAFQLFTSIGGEVIASFGSHDREGNTYISTKDFVLTVVSIADGAFLARGLVSAASQRVAAVMSKRFAAWAEKRALAAERKALETAGKSVAQNKAATLDTLTPKNKGATLDTLTPKKMPPGKNVDPFGATSVADTELAPLTPDKIAEFKRWDAFHAEFREELEKLRATKSVGYDAGGTGWPDEVVALMDRISKKWGFTQADWNL